MIFSYHYPINYLTMFLVLLAIHGGLWVIHWTTGYWVVCSPHTDHRVLGRVFTSYRPQGTGSCVHLVQISRILGRAITSCRSRGTGSCVHLVQISEYWVVRSPCADLRVLGRAITSYRPQGTGSCDHLVQISEYWVVRSPHTDHRVLGHAIMRSIVRRVFRPTRKLVRFSLLKCPSIPNSKKF